MNRRLCASCNWWELVDCDVDGVVGECRKALPVVCSADDVRPWPVTRACDWCGSHAKATPEKLEYDIFVCVSAYDDKPTELLTCLQKEGYK